MFRQTFVSTSTDHRKPFSLGLSLLLQAAALATLTVLPLLYSPGLPAVQLRSLLLMPVPPRAPAVVPSAASPVRTPSAQRFAFHPDTITRIPAISSAPVDLGPAPAIDIPDATGTATDTPALFGSTEAAPLPAPRPIPRHDSQPTVQRQVRVGGSVAEANLVTRVQPVYPPLARSARVSGAVEFTATISREGTIENLQLLHGHPLLIRAARDAILQWRYKPTLLNGNPVEVVTTIIVTFSLN